MQWRESINIFLGVGEWSAPGCLAKQLQAEQEEDPLTPYYCFLWKSLGFHCQEQFNVISYSVKKHAQEQMNNSVYCLLNHAETEVKYLRFATNQDEAYLH